MKANATESFVIWLALGWVVLLLIANWKIYAKMGEPGWKCLIPYYNTYILYRHVWSVGAFWVLMILSVGAVICNSLRLSSLAGILGLAVGVLSIVATVKLGKAFRCGMGFIVGLILLSAIFKLILAFGSAEYQEPQP